MKKSRKAGKKPFDLLFAKGLMAMESFAFRRQTKGDSAFADWLFATLPLITPERRQKRFTANAYERSEAFTLKEHNESVFDKERQILARFIEEKKRAIVAAMGAGRELKALLRLGVEVSGFDAAKTLVELARRDGELRQAKALLTMDYEAMLAIDTPKRLGIDSGAIDIFWFGWGSVSHLPVETFQAVLEKAADWLADGGIVVVSWIAYPERTKRRKAIDEKLVAFRYLLHTPDIVYDPHLGFLHGMNETVLKHALEGLPFLWIYHESDGFTDWLVLEKRGMS